MVKFPLPDPLGGDIYSQDGESLLTFHCVFEVTAMLVLDAAAPVTQIVGDKESVPPAWVTETERITPAPVTVIVPLLGVAMLFTAALMVKLPSPDPLAGDTVSHVTSL